MRLYLFVGQDISALVGSGEEDAEGVGGNDGLRDGRRAPLKAAEVDGGAPAEYRWSKQRPPPSG